MTISYSGFMNGTVLGTSAAAMFTVPASPLSTLLRGGRMRFTNTSGSAATVTAYNIPAAGSVSAANAFLNAKSIAANDYLDIDLPLMGAGATLQAFAGTAAAISAHMITGSYFS